MERTLSEHNKRTQNAIAGLRRLAGNVLSIFSSSVVTRATSYAIYVLIARYLSVREFGQMSLALTLFQTFQWLAIVGLETYITREIARDRSKTSKYLMNGSAIVVVFSLISTLCMIGFAIIAGYPQDTTLVIGILALGLLPYALSVLCDAVFKGWERMHHIISANILVNALKVGAVFYVFAIGQGLIQVALLITISNVAIFLVKFLLLVRYIERPRFNFDLQLALQTTRSTLPFMGIDILAAVMAGIGVFWLSKIETEADVGIYTAANQLMVPILLVMKSTLIGVFPILCRHFERGVENLRRLTENLLEIIVSSTIPMVVFIYLFSDDLLLLLYGDVDFLEATTVLRITVWLVITGLMNSVLGNVMAASKQELTNLRVLAVNLIIGIVVFPIMILQWGLVGAAIARVVVSGVSLVQHILPVLRVFEHRTLFLGAIGRPVVAGVCMMIYVISAGDQNPFLTLVIASVVYIVILSTLVLLSIGGPQRLREYYLNL